MKKLKRIDWMLPIILMMVMTVSCNQDQLSKENKVETEDVKKEAKEALQAAPGFKQERDAMRKELDTESARIDSMIKKTRSELAAAKDNTKTMLQSRVEALAKRKEALQRKYAKLEAATDESWEEIKAEIKEYIDSLQQEKQQPNMGKKYKF